MKNDDQIEMTGKREVAIPEGVERMENRRVFMPRVDVWEKKNETVLLVDMPGVNEKSLDVILEKNVLTLRGRVADNDFPGRNLIYREYETGDFERSFTISDEIDRDKIQAAVKDGVLSVRLPKASPNTRRIAVTAV